MTNTPFSLPGLVVEPPSRSEAVQVKVPPGQEVVLKADLFKK